MTINVVSETAISIPFKFDSRGNVVRTTDPSKIWADRVLSAVGTMKDERLYLPNYGSEVPLHTMDPLRSIEDLIYDDIASVFAIHLPLLKLKDVITTVNSEEGTMSVEVFYALPTTENVTTKIGFATLAGAGPVSEMPL